MPKLAANLSFLFQEHAFLDRFAAAADCGFCGVEFLFPYDHPADVAAAAAERAGVAIVLFNLPPGDWSAGERGIAALPGREAEFRAGVDQALAYAAALGTKTLHVMAGLVDEADRTAARRVYLDNLRYAADRAPPGLTLTIEPINQRDMPGYFLRNTTEAAAILDDVGAPNLKLQLDFYHAQISGGDLLRRLEALFPRVAHVQIAGVPHRHEPSDGEVHYPFLLQRLDALGYDGWVGCEYRPAAGTRAGLGWAAPYGIAG